MKLVIGNKQLSSWSLRPWLLLRHLELPFEEIALTLDTPEFGPEIRQYSPAGRVPVLVDGDIRAWPRDPARRAHARSISAEMHAGFAALRDNWPLQTASRGLKAPLSAQGIADVQRIEDLWLECLKRYHAEGPWLFGDYSAADAMYAPVVLRFQSYEAPVSPTSRTYMDHVLSDRHLDAWVRAARAEIAR